MNSFYLYILRCANGAFYVGHTCDIERRLQEHFAQDPGINGYVSRHLPAELVFTECVGMRTEAFAAEQRIKKWTRKKKEALIRRDWECLSELSKKKFLKD